MSKMRITKKGSGKIRAEYRVIKTTREGARYPVRREYHDETRGQLKPYDRMMAIAIGRDLERNSARTVSMMETRKNLAFGRVKMQMNTDNLQWNFEAERAFNAYFGEDCDYRQPDLHIVEMVQLVEAAMLREGDCLIVWGEKYVGEPKLLTWEADQLVTVDAADWKKQKEWRGKNPATGKDEPYPQFAGIVTDFFGKELAYVVQSARLADDKETRRGDVTARLSECMIIPVEDARLYRRSWRLNQGRGVPLLLPVADNIADANELLKNELLTAKAFGKRGYFVEQSDASASADTAVAAEKLLAALTAETTSGEETSGEVVVEKKRYRELEQSDANIVEYLDTGDKIVPAPNDRPNLSVSEFYQQVNDEAGAAFGLAQGYSRMQVNSSYTAHRGETNLTVAHINAAQKRAERGWLDWLAVKVIDYYIRQGFGGLQNPPAGWRRKIGWSFPRIPNVDPQREIAAEALALKNGLKTYRDILGPDWRRQFDELAAEAAYIREKGLPLAILETVAGAMAGQPDEEVTQTEE